MPLPFRGVLKTLTLVLTAMTVLLLPAEAMASSFKPGDVFRDCVDCPQMLVVPPGSFIMGSSEAERRKFNVPSLFDKMESPQHPVTIAHAYAVGRFSVTMAEWEACLADGGCGGYRPDDNGWGRGTRPVINVNWADAQAYVYWISRKTGFGYRLLSEAEWEYAARGGATTPFFFGSAVSEADANYGSLRKSTLPAGSFPPNRFGLYDMAGNTAQWVQDCYHDSYAGAPSDGSAWLSGECVNRNVRGGAWALDSWCLRAAQRIGDPPASRNNHLGFRVARSLQ